MYCQKIINNVFEPNSFRYLELGLGDEVRYKEVHTDNKISVDINGRASFNEGTDKFFEDYKLINGDNRKFDCIYVDASHEYKQVTKDYNNGINFLKKNGIIFIHDLYPPDKNHCSINSCGDGFKLLYHFNKIGVNYRTIPEEFGLTCIFKNDLKKIDIEEVENISYEQFTAGKEFYRTVDSEHLVDLIITMKNIDIRIKTPQ